MKKLFHYALLFVAAGVLSLGFASCSDDDDDDSSASERVAIPATALQSAFNNYVNNIVYTNYEDLQAAAADLQEACAQLYNEKVAGNVTQPTIDDACGKFKIARRYWEQSEAFLYGPATDDGLDPHTDSWPLDQTELADALTDAGVIEAINGNNAAEYLDANNDKFQSVLGYHGLEFILFRNGANRTAAAFNATMEDGSGLNTKGSNVEENRSKLQTVTTLNEAAFAKAVSEDLRNATKLLAYEWDGNSTLKNFITNNCSWYWKRSIYTDQSTHDFTTGMSYGARVNGLKSSGSGYLFDSWQADLSNVLLGGCQSICQEVHTQKLGQAYRVATGSGGDEDAGDYIESPYSKRSFQDYQDNIYGIRNVLYGQRGTRDAANSNTESTVTPQSGSFMAILNQYYTQGYTTELKDEDGNPTGETATGNATTLRQALETALSTLEAAKNSGTAFIDKPEDAQVLRCINAVTALDNQLQVAAAWVTANVDIAQ